MSTLSYTLNQNQYNAIQGFFAHLWAAYWDKGNKDYAGWAKILDGLQIPWWVQNQVSGLADKRESAFLYLRPQLSKLGIEVSQSWN